jgi:hypothetical protein
MQGHARVSTCTCTREVLGQGHAHSNAHAQAQLRAPDGPQPQHSTRAQREETLRRRHHSPACAPQRGANKGQPKVIHTLLARHGRRGTGEYTRQEGKSREEQTKSKDRDIRHGTDGQSLLGLIPASINAPSCKLLRFCLLHLLYLLRRSLDLGLLCVGILRICGCSTSGRLGVEEGF